MSIAEPTTTSFVYWPTPSPTSKYNINVRYYRIEDKEAETSIDWDLGPNYEHTLEALYDASLAAGKAQTPKQFEEFIRNLMGARITFMAGATAYPAVLALLLGNGDDLYDDMVRQTDTMVKLHNRAAKVTGLPTVNNPLKRSSPWKKLFS